MSKVSKKYIKVQGIQKIPKGTRYVKGAKRSKVSKGYVKVQCFQKVHKGPRYAKGT